MEKRSTILLVEDNPDDERLTLMGFRENNILNPIKVARDGAEAIDFISGQGAYADRDPSTPPQLIVLDLKLPKVDGIEVLRYIRTSPFTQFTPVVILTSSREEKDLVESYRLGVNAYVQKPIDFLEFTQAVKHLGMFWLLLNEIPYQSQAQALSPLHG
ncbi:MAG: response regulator [Vampirovibrionales bacterium]|nr:response regulator [Vampirovibrionales bacterium]